MVQRAGVEGPSPHVLHLGVVEDSEHLVFVEVDYICGILFPCHQALINAALNKERVLAFLSNVCLGLFIPLLVSVLPSPMPTMSQYRHASELCVGGMRAFKLETPRALPLGGRCRSRPLDAPLAWLLSCSLDLYLSKHCSSVRYNFSKS
jgi:hypothetical protein